MQTIRLAHDESRTSKPKPQNVAGIIVTRRPSEGTPGCNCDRWGHPFPSRAAKRQVKKQQRRQRNRTSQRTERRRNR